MRIDLLDPETFRSYSARPERLEELVAAHPKAQAVVVDEVQKVPDLLSVVHRLVERKRRVRFILTGSSTRKIKRAGVDLLAGRLLLRTLHPFMAGELGDSFRLDAALEQGLVPLVVDSPDAAEVLRSYVALYVREEVQAEGLVRNVGNFARFLEAISFSHAGVLNVSTIARECQVGRKVLESYIAILEDVLIAFRLPVFTKRAKRATVSHPKFFLFDAGVYRSLRRTGPLERPEEVHGAGLEGLVAQHLRAWIAYGGKDAQMFYWRTRGGSEVDFVLYGADGFWAIEVKHSARVDRTDLRALKAFRQDYPECRPLLVYQGPDRLRIDGILCVPCGEFLRQLHPARALDAGL